MLFCVGKHHRHSRRLSGDDERAKIFPKTFDLGLGDSGMHHPILLSARPQPASDIISRSAFFRQWTRSYAFPWVGILPNDLAVEALLSTSDRGRTSRRRLAGQGR